MTKLRKQLVALCGAHNLMEWLKPELGMVQMSVAGAQGPYTVIIVPESEEVLQLDALDLDQLNEAAAVVPDAV